MWSKIHHEKLELICLSKPMYPTQLLIGSETAMLRQHNFSYRNRMLLNIDDDSLFVTRKCHITSSWKPCFRKVENSYGGR